jgi:hypothetical protein
MAYLSKDLSVAWYANGTTGWHYTTADTAAQVLAPGYFNAAADMLRVGDTITTNTDTAGKPGCMLLHVSKCDSNTATVEPMLSTASAA